jgi:hypothetical protein
MCGAAGVTATERSPPAPSQREQDCEGVLAQVHTRIVERPLSDERTAPDASLACPPMSDAWAILPLQSATERKRLTFVPTVTSSQGASLPRQGVGLTSEIRFYRLGEPFGELSNFAPFSIELNGLMWPTSEHYYQAMKFPSKSPVREKIRASAKAFDARRAAWRVAEIAAGWGGCGSP